MSDDILEMVSEEDERLRLTGGPEEPQQQQQQQQLALPEALTAALTSNTLVYDTQLVENIPDPIISVSDDARNKLTTVRDDINNRLALVLREVGELTPEDDPEAAASINAITLNLQLLAGETNWFSTQFSDVVGKFNQSAQQSLANATALSNDQLRLTGAELQQIQFQSEVQALQTKLSSAANEAAQYKAAYEQAQESLNAKILATSELTEQVDGLKLALVQKDSEYGSLVSTRQLELASVGESGEELARNYAQLQLTARSLEQQAKTANELKASAEKVAELRRQELATVQQQIAAKQLDVQRTNETARNLALQLEETNKKLATEASLHSTALNTQRNECLLAAQIAESKHRQAFALLESNKKREKAEIESQLRQKQAQLDSLQSQLALVQSSEEEQSEIAARNISERDRQITELKLQVEERERQYRLLESSKRSLDDTVQSLQQQLESRASENLIEGKSARESELEAAVRSNEATIAQQKKIIDQLTQTAEEQILAITSAGESSSAELLEAQEKNSANEVKIGQLTRENARLSKLVSTTRGELEELARLRSSDAEAARGREESLQAEIEKEQQRALKMNIELTQLRSADSQNKARISALEQQKQVSEGQLRTIESTVDEPEVLLRSQYAAEIQKRQSIEKQYDAAKKRIEFLEEEVAQYEKENATSASKQQSNDRERSMLQEKISTSTVGEGALQSELRSVRKDLEDQTRALEKVQMYFILGPSTISRLEGRFNPSINTNHRSVLIYDSDAERRLDEWIKRYDQTSSIMVQAGNDLIPIDRVQIPQGTTLVAVPDDVYANIVAASELPGGGGELARTPKTQLRPKFPYKAPLILYNANLHPMYHLELLQQQQLFSLAARNIEHPQSRFYTAEVHFSTGVPNLRTMDQLWFFARDVTLIDVEAQQKRGFVISLKDPSHIEYRNAGVLARDCIFGNGNVVLAIRDQTSASTVKQVELSYALGEGVKNDGSLPYNTEAVVYVRKDVAFYVRTLGDNTYKLDMIVVFHDG